ncbi:winged helix-turn-helix domain-containing protein [Dysgonomonas sp. GY75]|jgi:hypothetical protein|uniref:winged helix-turn-helix domain-containing protein n=1 Tax=Dysgonomonas sp. GY75 TaxID=2780419 RepID=UPI0018840DFA|nr:winged helix-turn-helix domain-containing protein [Dysgonomonas sp. GY75]MBF0650799.1 winged helix-turn-helix domain-containing protein [Dysgonomonas sp. GY75]
MNKRISDNAGHISELLSSNGEMNVRQIGEHTHRRDPVIFMAIGWLMKEDHVRTEDRNGRLYFILKKDRPEIYY